MTIINVVNNTGNIIIGNEITYCDGLSPDRSGSDQLTGGLVVADGADVVLPSPQRGPVFCIDRNAMQWLEKFYRITNEIYPLRDNGRWEDFYEKVNTGILSANRNGQSEVEIFLMIEKSTALSYQGKNGESKTMVKQAKDMIFRPGLNMQEFLIALAHCQLAALYRRESKFDKSNNALSIAERNVEVLPSDLARVYVIYEKASNCYIQHSHDLSKSKQDRDSLAERAKREFKNCIDMCERMLSSEKDIYLRRHHFCYVKLAILNLDCVTTEARNQPVSDACIREAGDCITRMRQRYSGEMGESTIMLLHTAETGHFHRLGDYGSAEISARQALQKAVVRGFQLQVEELQDNLKHMQSLSKKDQEQQK